MDRPPYTYKSGAVYTGKWQGGFRSGYGEIKWSDGAVYKGEWSFNHAHGKGIFLHADGERDQGGGIVATSVYIAPHAVN